MVNHGRNKYAVLGALLMTVSCSVFAMMNLDFLTSLLGAEIRINSAFITAQTE